ncbi:DNA repair protein RadC [Variovorax boronicumulans]|uniref:JAB domain-containing protein n=1 Tax=Variovorax boronicumulans TaxID=436515 RepID=UPI00278217F4|nr:JAB domain-containing protein [Variovorax boronicumulans]MDP9993893.1 DNA repair protein RadC [Variovorax boronicumulans]MDQ0005244.1 DNA repair protein RadC [Variovorax boronicumulans]MDQ0036645.1 DNA repair protein RadC [Variovorax boronicumulans]
MLPVHAGQLGLASLRLAHGLQKVCPPKDFSNTSCADAVSDDLKLHLTGQAHESCAALFLSAQHTMLAFEAMFRGTLRQTGVYPCEMVKRALQLNASAVIPAHSHPFGQGRAIRYGRHAHAGSQRGAGTGGRAGA